MSRRKFVLSLASNYLIIQVLRAPSGKSLRSAWQQSLAYLRGDTPSNFEVMETRYLEGDTSGPGLAILLQGALDAINTLAPTAQERLLDVVLGPTLSRVGVVERGAAGETPHWSDAERDAYVQAWVAQNWGMQTQACVIRNAPLGKQGRHLVTCIERVIIQNVEVLCAQAGFQLASCTPMLAHQLSRLLIPVVDRGADKDMAQPGSLRVCVCVQATADGGRLPLVHFVVLDAGEPLTITRMWLPDAGLSSQDRLYRSVVDRLRVQVRSAMEPVVEVFTWPSGVPGGHAP